MGLTPDFDAWEGDYTDLVHVLWKARSDGILPREVDCDQLATRIMQSRWHQATRNRAVEEDRRKTLEELMKHPSCIYCGKRQTHRVCDECFASSL